MKAKYFLLLSLSALLVGCGEKVEIGPIEVPPSREGTLSPAVSTNSPVNKVLVEYQDKFEVKTAVLDFEPRGIIEGKSSPMIPLEKGYSNLSSLGFTSYISNDGQEALVTYNDTQISFEAGNKTAFVNEDDAYQMGDAPYYMNSTLYVPLIPILKILHIDHRINGNELIIGGNYTDPNIQYEQVQHTQDDVPAEDGAMSGTNPTTENSVPTEVDVSSGNENQTNDTGGITNGEPNTESGNIGSESGNSLLGE